jgi:hypothetical protein
LLLLADDPYREPGGQAAGRARQQGTRLAQPVLDERRPRDQREAAHRGTAAVAPACSGKRKAGEREEGRTHWGESNRCRRT